MNKLLVLLFPLLFSLLSVEGRAASSGNVNIERSALLSDVLDSQSLQLSQEADDREEHFHIGFKHPTLRIKAKQARYSVGAQASNGQTVGSTSIRAPPSIL
tara:strand:- start:128 stop:430 length:303 start_codon:yes stop_codon:yes gene_type:complete